MAHLEAHALVPPVRGLVLLHNEQGRPIRPVDIHRWINYLRTLLDIRKIDALAHGPISESVHNTFAYTRWRAMAFSLRTDASASPDGFDRLAGQAAQNDVFLCPRCVEEEHLRAWLGAARKHSLPIRVQLQAPYLPQMPIAELVGLFADHGVCSVNLVVADPFLPSNPSAGESESRALLERVFQVAEGLETSVAEVNLFGFPFQTVPAPLLRIAGSLRHFYADHQQYDQISYEFAAESYARSPKVLRMLVLLRLARHAAQLNVSDAKLVSFLGGGGLGLQPQVKFLSKLWRTCFGLTHKMQPVTRNRPPADVSLLPQEIEVFHTVFSGVALSEEAPSTGVFLPQRKRYFDEIDSLRLLRPEKQRELAKCAAEYEQRTPPSEVWGMDHWGGRTVFYTLMSGAEKWYALRSNERISTRLPELTLPCMISVTFGGGLAEMIGFSIGRQYRILCPMVDTSHTLTLIADETGEFALLRDGAILQPAKIAGRAIFPDRLPAILKVRICVWDIHDEIAITPIKVWSGALPPPEEPKTVKYSIVLFCTRFSRRLTAALQCIAHQEGIALEKLEVIVAYVPGLDGTEDAVDAVRLVYPELRIVLWPFPPQNQKSKGFAINEAIDVGTGEWIMVMDSDILLPPQMFSRLEDLTREHKYIAPAGRGMLDSVTTAKILLGAIAPWEVWDELLEGVVENRDREAKGIPIGFSQVFHRSCLDKVRYKEYEHFEGADWEFGKEMREHFGEEHRMDLRVLHLDHRGSQWYGTQRQF